MLAVYESPDDDGRDEDGGDIAAQGVVEKVIAERAVGQQGDKEEEGKPWTSTQGENAHDPATQVSDQRNVMTNTCSHVDDSDLRVLQVTNYGLLNPDAFAAHNEIVECESRGGIEHHEGVGDGDGFEASE